MTGHLPGQSNQTMHSITFSNAQLVLPDAVTHGALTVDGEHITAIHAEASGPVPGSASGAMLDLGGDLLLPGLVELHTDHLETHLQPRPGVIWPSPLAAMLAHDAQLVAAGITTVLDSLCCGDLHAERNRNALLKLSLDAVRQAVEQGLTRAEHLLHLRCEVCDPEVTGMFLEVADTPGLRLVSLMDHTPGQRQFASLGKFRQYYKSKNFNWDDAEFENTCRALEEQQARYAGPNRRRIVGACAERGVPLASHDDTTACHILEARSDNVAVSEFPTSVAAAKAAREAHIAVVMGAPNVVRGGSHSGNVSALELARQGLLDILSSDYVPVSLLHGAFVLHTDGGMDLPSAVATVTANPADAVGLIDRGRLVQGLNADLVRVSLLNGLPVVRGVWRKGRQVF